MTEQQEPTVGRIVRYHRLDGGREHAAIITDVAQMPLPITQEQGIAGDLRYETIVDLDIFWGHRLEEPLPSDAYIPYSADGAPGHWSWPVRPVPPAQEIPAEVMKKPVMDGRHVAQKLGFLSYPGDAPA